MRALLLSYRLGRYIFLKVDQKRGTKPRAVRSLFSFACLPFAVPSPLWPLRLSAELSSRCLGASLIDTHSPARPEASAAAMSLMLSSDTYDIT